MKGHPLVEAAAVALLCGWDPMAWAAAADGSDRVFADAVLTRAAELRAEEMRTVIEGIGAQVAVHVAKLLR